MRSLIVGVALLGITGCGGAAEPEPLPPPQPVLGRGVDQHGPKCTVELTPGPPVECLSAGIARHGDTTVLTFNFCWRNDTYVCEGAPVAIDGMFILPGPTWREGVFTQGAGFLDVNVTGGARHRLDPPSPGGAIPLDLRVESKPVTGGGTTMRGQHEVRLPRVDRPGDPLLFRAEIN
jgi:hypothetical protein